MFSKADSFNSLAAKWRDVAATLRHYSASPQGQVLEACAAELETAVREWLLETLTIEQAAEESGYSYSAIQKQIASGVLENAGAKGRPLVRRSELPKKGGQSKAADGIAETILASRSA
jgi:hypothetical protein